MPTHPVRANALALPAATPHTFAHQPELRALPTLPALPPDCMTFQVPDDAFHPHLRRGEFVVIDLADRQPAHGELFLQRFEDWRIEGGFCHCLVKATASAGFYGRPQGWPECQPGISFAPAVGFEPVTVWHLVYWLPPADPAEYRAALREGWARLADGPFRTEPLARKLVGRVIGLFVPGRGGNV